MEVNDGQDSLSEGELTESLRWNTELEILDILPIETLDL